MDKTLSAKGSDGKSLDGQAGPQQPPSPTPFSTQQAGVDVEDAEAPASTEPSSSKQTSPPENPCPIPSAATGLANAKLNNEGLFQFYIRYNAQKAQLGLEEDKETGGNEEDYDGDAEESSLLPGVSAKFSCMALLPPCAPTPSTSSGTPERMDMRAATGDDEEDEDDEGEEDDDEGEEEYDAGEEEEDGGEEVDDDGDKEDDEGKVLPGVSPMVVRMVAQQTAEPTPSTSSGSTHRMVTRMQMRRMQENDAAFAAAKMPGVSSGKMPAGPSTQQALTPETGKEKKYPCPVEGCPGVFTQTYHLGVHLNSVHHKIKAPCQICGKELSSDRSLRRHMQTIHSQEPE